MIGIEVRGLPEVQQALAQLEPAPLKKLLQKASSAGARTIKPYVVAETPRRSGRMRKSISARQARRDRPAAIVVFRPKVAYYRHIVIRGAAPHRIRFPDQRAAGVPKREGNIRHPGHAGNDVMGRAWSAGRTPTLEAVRRVISTYLAEL